MHLFTVFVAGLLSVAVVPAADSAEQNQARRLELARKIRTISARELINQVTELYPEMNWLTGEVHATPEGAAKGGDEASPSKRLFGRQHIEFDRTANGVAFLAWVLGGRYDEFVAPQPVPVRLSRAGFAHLQRYTESILRTPEDIDAMITSMVINDLGKIDKVVKHMEEKAGLHDVDHDRVLLQALRSHPEISPSFQRLSPQYRDLMLRGIASQFNIGQFMQGEGVAAGLQRLVGLDQPTLDFYFLHALSDIAGAAGHIKTEGSLVMNEATYDSFRTAVETLSALSRGGRPADVYNGYVGRRAVALGIDASTAEGFAEARVAMMVRASKHSEAEEIKGVFGELPANTRALLVDNLGQTGIGTSSAVLLYYAPATLANLRKALADRGHPQPSRRALEIGLTVFARLYQEARIMTRRRAQGGVFTVLVNTVANAAKTDPEGLLDKDIVLTPVGDDAQAELEDLDRGSFQ